jgi:GNAT superfamily N-acetyltransferase
MAAVRYSALYARVPFLPEQYVNPEAIMPRLTPHLGHVPGVAALRDSQLVGFIMSLLVDNRGERLAYVPDFGHAALPGHEFDAYRQMYAWIGDQWLANGCFWHGITAYAGEQSAVNAWFSVGFGLTVMDALGPLKPQALSPDPAPVEGMKAAPQTIGPRPGIVIRRAGVEDVELVAPLEIALDRHLSASPTYLPFLLRGGRASLREWLDDESHILWLAVHQAQAIAYLRLEPSEGVVLPTSGSATVSITGAYTREDVRGTGVGTALLRQGLEWARSAGYCRCAVDFESANLPGSRFWLQHFQPVTYSLTRRVSPNLAWANERRRDLDVQRAYNGQTWTG